MCSPGGREKSCFIAVHSQSHKLAELTMLGVPVASLVSSRPMTWFRSFSIDSSLSVVDSFSRLFLLKFCSMSIILSRISEMSIGAPCEKNGFTFLINLFFNVCRDYCPAPFSYFVWQNIVNRYQCI